MDDPRAAEGLEHLQRAARELVAAARSLLDVAEEVIDDDERFEAAAGSVVELLRQGARHVGAVAEPIWVAAATRPGGGASWPSAASESEPTEQDELGSDPADPAEPATDTSPSDRPAPPVDLRARRSPGRVRRITVEGDVGNP